MFTNLEAAGSSRITFTLGCNCNALAGTIDEMGPSIALDITSDFPSPKAKRRTDLVSRIVPTPIVIQCLGTSFSLSKKRALSLMVSPVKVFMRVLELNDEQGSLKPMCPSEPIPRICKSMPPASKIDCS